MGIGGGNSFSFLFLHSERRSYHPIDLKVHKPGDETFPESFAGCIDRFCIHAGGLPFSH